MIAALRVRGEVGVDAQIRDTLTMLNMRGKNVCALLEDKPEVLGMLQKVKDFITWGEVDDETVTMLKEKAKGKKAFRLHPPRGGFERKGIKVPYSKGGVLGNRKEKMNDLVRRMLP